jgi:hypothetical protein
MAITINQYPAVYSPAYNDLIFHAISDNVDEPNFQYSCDIYINGTFTTRHRVPPNVIGGVCKFDARKVIESYVTHDIDSTTEDFAKNENSWVYFQIKFGEEYDVAGVKTLTADMTTSATIYAYNSIFDFNDFVDYDSDDFGFGSTGVEKRFLTNAPSSQNVREGNKLWLHSFTSGSQANYVYLQVKKYSANGTLLDTDNISNTFTAVSDENRFLRVGVGHWNITEALGATYLDDAAYYTVQATNGAGLTLSELRTFVVDDSCTKYEVIRLQFLNKLGGFDAFNFTKLSRTTHSIEREEYKKSPGTLSDSAFTLSKSDRQVNTMSTVIKERISINSDWISEEESTWLFELISSPIVFQEKSNGDLIPVKLLETGYEKKKVVNDKLFNLKIDLEYSHSNFRQRY